MTRYKKTYENENKVLDILIRKQEFFQYDFPKKIGKDYRTTQRTLHILAKKGMIRVTRTEPPSRGGKDKIVYESLIRGLLYALSNYTNRDVELEDLIELNKERLPIVFRYFDFFRRENLIEAYMWRLKGCLSEYRKYIRFSYDVDSQVDVNDLGEDLATAMTIHDAEILRDYINFGKKSNFSLDLPEEHVYVTKVFFSWGNYKDVDFFKVLNRDGILKKLAYEMLEKEIKSIEERYNELTNFVNWWKSV